MSRQNLPLLALAAGLCLTAPHLLEADEPTARTLVQAGVLIDGVSDSPRREVTVVVEGDRIIDVVSDFLDGEADDTVVDVSFVMKDGVVYRE